MIKALSPCFTKELNFIAGFCFQSLQAYSPSKGNSVWRRTSGLVVSAQDSGSGGPGSGPGRVIVLCPWARHFTLTVPLSTRSINGYQQTVRET